MFHVKHFETHFTFSMSVTTIIIYDVQQLFHVKHLEIQSHYKKKKCLYIFRNILSKGTSIFMSLSFYKGFFTGVPAFLGYLFGVGFIFSIQTSVRFL